MTSTTGHGQQQPLVLSSLCICVLLQEEDIVSWDGDELNRIHNLHVREFKDMAVSQAPVGSELCQLQLLIAIRTRLSFHAVCCCIDSTAHQLVAQQYHHSLAYSQLRL
jgi:hypothetical protein